MPIEVSIVEDKDELRAAFVRLIDQSDGFKCVSHYANAEDALEGLPMDPPDVVLMDIQLPGMTGIECVRRLKAKVPSIQIVMLTVFEDTGRIFESLRAGATGYILKRAPATEILDAIRYVQSGGAPMSGSVARKVVEFFNKVPPNSSLERLTDREREVLAALSEGQFYKEIADSLGITMNTVRKHLRSIYEKLHVHSRTEAVTKFIRRQEQK